MTKPHFPSIRRVWLLWYALIFALVGGIWIGCLSNQQQETPSFRLERRREMMWVISSQLSIQLGSDDILARASEERPRMQVGLDYSFGLDTVEVTQALWSEVMGKAARTKDMPGRGERLPVYFVTWYDAILFCNARSKRSGYDTVYSYVRAHFDSSGHARDLSGLVSHFDKLGYRLPTESEWQWFASENGVKERASNSESLKEVAWYIGNSYGKISPVATKKPNAFGIYDLFGNVMEWTQDWKGPLHNLRLDNFVGQLIRILSMKRW